MALIYRRPELSRAPGVMVTASSRMTLPMIAAVLLLGFGFGTAAQAGLIIDPTFDTSITSDPGSAGIEGAINAAIGAVEADISSPNNTTVKIYFTEMSGGLGESETGFYAETYHQYYNAFAAVATQPNQLTALASLGPAPGLST